VTDPTGTVGIMSKLYGYARRTAPDPLPGRLEALRAHGIDDGNVFVDDDADARPAWSTLLATLVAGADGVRPLGREPAVTLA
jgi:hypothetical protein